MGIYNLISEKIILPFGDILLGQSVSKNLNFLLKSQWWNWHEIIQYQNTKLRELVLHSYNHVNYYKNLFDNIGLKPSDIKNKLDLKKIPILTKSIIKEKGIESFTSSQLIKQGFLGQSSSGSTGEPLFYYNTLEAYSLNLAANLRGWYWMGFRLGDKFIKLSQNSRTNPIKRIQDLLSNNLYLSVNPLTDNNFSLLFDKIEAYKPKIIRCYPDPLLFLSRFKKRCKNLHHSPHAINTTGNTLSMEARYEIESIFNCKIFDSYSCEGTATFFECPTHECYHAADEYGIIEILDDEGNSVTDGIGRLITTDLWNTAHPFIRYDTQDFVEVKPRLCNCGRKHTSINRILGRDNDFIEMPNGRKYIVHNFTGFFQTDFLELKRSIDQFQVIKKNNSVIFRLVVNNHFDETVSSFISNYWEAELQTNIIIEIVDFIQLTLSGKRRFIINE